MIQKYSIQQKKLLGKVFKNKSIIITGGTGSFGKAFIYRLLEFKSIKKIIIFSRDELKQEKFRLEKKIINDKRIRFIIGDIRDLQSLNSAFENVDYVIHAAALKQVVTAEYNPFEFIKTNVLGSQNIIEASLKNNVKNVIALSTDKASSPINLYGATKLCSDKLFVSAQNLVGRKKIKFSVVRYGNVMSSRGSVIPKMKDDLKKYNKIFITHKNMTRFNITLQESVNFVMNSLLKSRGGEIFIPKLPSYKIMDLARAINKKVPIDFIGIRPGEKMHEEMISSSDSSNTIEFKNYFVIIPANHPNVFNTYPRKKLKFVKDNFQYSSGENTHFLSTTEIKKIIKYLN